MLSARRRIVHKTDGRALCRRRRPFYARPFRWRSIYSAVSLSICFLALASAQGNPKLILLPEDGQSDPRAKTALMLPPPATALGIDTALLDRRARPCDDFYRFACGGWLDRTEIPAGHLVWSHSFSEIQERNQNFLRQILQDISRKQKALHPSDKGRKFAHFYSACMSEKNIEKTALAELALLLQPVSAIKTLSDLAREVSRQHQGLSEPFFRLYPQRDPKEPNRIVAGLGPGGFCLPSRKDYVDATPTSLALQKD